MKSHTVQSSNKKKLSLEKEEAIDPLFHLFTEIPLTSFQRDPEFFKNSKNANNGQQITSQNSERNLSYSSSADCSTSLRYRASSNSETSQRSTLSNDVRCKKTNSQKDRLKRLRIKNMCKNLGKKFMRNNVYSIPVEGKQLQLGRINIIKGFSLTERFNLCWGVLASLLLVFLFVVQSLALVFIELQKSQYTSIILCLGVLYICGEIMLGFGSVKYVEGQKIDNLSQIVKEYSKGQLLFDCGLLFILLFMLSTYSSVLNVALLVIVFTKLLTISTKLQPIKNKLCHNSTIEAFLPFLKIIALNLALAHIIAIFLNLMTVNNPEESWQALKGIDTKQWMERYVWSYFWAVSILTTVGLGDMSPSSYKEAIWVIFIEVACSIVFAYNIYLIGKIFSKEQKPITEGTTRIFGVFADQHGISQSVKEKVSRYIEDEKHMQNKYKIQQQNELIAKLPQDIKSQVQHQSTKHSLRLLPFFNELPLKAILSLSHYLQRSICLPNHTVKHLDDQSTIFILEKGNVGYSCYSPHSILHHQIVNSIERKEKEQPFLLSLDFLSLQRQKIQIKSISSSIILRIPLQRLTTAFSAFPQTYEYFCLLRDRAQRSLDGFQTMPCDLCKEKHTKIACPRLHFMPLKQLVISKHLQKLKEANSKGNHPRIMRRKMNILYISKILEQDYCKIQPPVFAHYEETRKTLRQVPTQASSFGDMQSGQDWNSIYESIHLENEGREREVLIEDGVWAVASDRIQNYKVYFPKDNLEPFIKQKP